MDVCKCIVPLWHGGTQNSSRAASPLVMLVKGEDRWKASDPSPRVFSLKIRVENRSPNCFRLWELSFLPFGKDTTTRKGGASSKKVGNLCSI
ncbi:hypothetical protein TNCV_3289261 [Trichonephila clavipes]|nr:hypothetical protein TNCV_3289261 [Trichonephila clavipes]